MESRLLKMFCVVVKSGSLVTAAGTLHLTPSAVSHGIKALETELGCRLFERSSKRLLITQAGEQLLAQIETPLAALEAATESIKRLGQRGQTRLRIGTAASACQHILPAVIRELKKTHHHLELLVASGDMPEMVELVHANKLDLALGIAPDTETGLEVRSIFRDELMFVFAPTHPWAAGRPISREEIRSQPLVLYQRSSYTTQMVNQFFRALDLVPSTIMEIGSIEAIKELVKLNLGVSVLAPWTAHRELTRGTLRMRPLGAKPIKRRWVMISLLGRRLNPAEETFCKLCRAHAAGMRLDRRDVPVLKS